MNQNLTEKADELLQERGFDKNGLRLTKNRLKQDAFEKHLARLRQVGLTPEEKAATCRNGCGKTATA